MADHDKPICKLLRVASVEQPRHTEASIIVLDDGRLLMAWTEFYSPDWADFGAAAIKGMWSNDHGDSWSEPFVLQENIGKRNVMSASLALLPSGRILLAFHRKDVESGDLVSQLRMQQKPGYVKPDVPAIPNCHIMVKWSDDNAESWAEPIQITDGTRYWCGTNDRIRVLDSGRILIPVGEDSIGLTALYSDDDGGSWSRSEQTIPGNPEGTFSPTDGAPFGSFAEPAVVQLADGVVLMLIRAKGGFLLYGRSDDEGITWRLWERNDSAMLSAPPSPCNCKRVPGSDDLLLVWNNNGSRRIPLTTAISSDGSKSWKHMRDLEPYTQCPPGHTYSYPSITFYGDNVLLTYWDSFRTEPQRAGSPGEVDLDGGHDTEKRLFHLKYQRLPLSWFYEVS